MPEEFLILVDENDNEIGTQEKLAAHKAGNLHRCFSIFVFNSKGELLLQKRAKEKYHSGGLWTNVCCGHQRPGEDTLHAAHRRLKEEMGFDCDLKEVHQFIYRAKLDHDLTEHEYDHVMAGVYDGDPVPDPDEAEDWKWVNPEEVKRDMAENPELYTYWFREAFDDILPACGGAGILLH